MHCILTTTKEFQELLTQTKLDEKTLKAAIAVWQEDNGVDNWPTMGQLYSMIGKDTQTSIKPGVSELFEDNPELANAVYEALGFEISIKNPIYSAVFFDTASLTKRFKQVHPNLYSHHSTIEFKPKDVSNLSVGENRNIKIVGRLTTDKVDVLIVENPLSKNKFPHITLSTTEGVKPFQSNSEIENNQDKIQPLNQEINGIIGVFDGKNEITSIITPQQKQQAQQLYSQYLDTIFPDSKVKDIVYHGTDTRFDAFDKKKIGKKHTGFGSKHSFDDPLDIGIGFYFVNSAPYIKYVNADGSYNIGNSYGKIVIPAILNLQTPYTYDVYYKKLLFDDKIVGTNISRITWDQFQDELSYIPGHLTGRTINSINKEFNKNGDSIIEIVRDNNDINSIDINQIVVFEPEQIHILGSKQDIEGFKNFMSKGQLFQKTATKSKPISKLEETLQKWFNVAGVQYNSVEDLEVNGEKVVAKADILRGILEVVEGRRDASTLAEEAAHFLVEMLPENHPVLLTMMNSVSGTKMYQKVVDEYGAIYNYDSIRLRKEAVGKLIAQEVLNKIQETKESDTTSSKFTKFFNAILNWIKTKFKFLNSNTVYQELEAYKTAAEIILNPENTQELIDSGGLKKYGESNWNSKISDYMYQVSSSAEEITANINANLTTKVAKLVNGIYQTPQGKVLNRRVTDYVKDFYAKIFKTKDLTSEEATYRKLKGTYIHKIAQIFITNRIKGLPTDGTFIMREAQDELMRTDPEFVAAYREMGNELWSLGDTGYASIKKGLNDLLLQIDSNNAQINALTGLNKPFKVYSEVAIYDEAEDTAGTIDLLVVYPNGVVGIYDFKSMNFGFNKDISSTKIEAFQIQLDWYKKILVQNYGVKDFRESRIIPIDVKLTKDNKVYSVSMTEDYLQPIPIKELTGNKKFDAELEKLYGYADSLRIKLRKNYKDEAVRLRLFRVEKSIRSMLVDKELKFLDAELQDISKELNLRSSIDSQSADGKVLTDEDINEMLEFVTAIKGTVSRFNETLDQDSTEDQRKAAEIITGKVIQLENTLRDKVKELINKVNPEEDVDNPHKQLGFFSRIFNPVFDIDSPIIRKVQKLIQNMSFSVVKEVNELVSDVEAKKNDLSEWAKAKGMSLMDAYELMINENTGNLVTRLSSQYYQDRKEALSKGGIDKENWIKKYHTFDKEAFAKKRAERVALIEKEYPGTSAYRVKIRETKINDFDKKYNVNKYDSAINENNWFLKINESALPKDYFNDKWSFIQAKGNEALKNYYDSYIKYNEQFAAITGRDINRNFVAELRKDALSRAVSNGVGSLFNVKNMFLEMLEVRQDDAMLGSFDPVTGKPIPSIPLLYTDDLRSRLTTSELKKLESEASSKYKKGTSEYIDNLKSLVSRAERTKGLKTKSYDLTRSLVLFAKSAYTYKHLKESEAYVKNLKYYIETGGGKANITDGADAPMYNKFTKKVMTVSGVPTSELELLDNIIQGVWYGRSMLDKDRIFNEKSITDSEGNIIGRTTGFSRNKSIRNLMTYISVRALGLNPFSAAGNFIGTRTNLLMLGSEGNIIDNKAIARANKRAYTDRKKYLAASEILQPYAHNRVQEIANNLSATKLEKLLTLDNAFVLMKHPDEQIDRIITNAMLEKYGISGDGKILHIRKLPEGSKTLLDLLQEDSKGNWSFFGVSDEELSKFRVSVYKISNKIKGSVPDEMKASYSRTLTGKVLMHFRGWMPGLISTRFKDTSYDPDLDELDAGRFRVAWGEIFNSGSFLSGMKEFGVLLAEATITGYFNGGLKKINMNATKIAFDKFRLSNPEQAANLTIEDFIELRKAKLKGMATELRAYFLMAMLMLLAKSIIPDDDEESLERFMSRNAYMMANRGFLELSFFLQPSSVKQILKSPVPAMQMLWDTELLLRNTVDESIDLISGRKDNRDKTPFTYYTVTRFLPFGKTTADIFDIYESFKTK